MTYGSVYREQIVEKLRRAAENCDCLQCFFLIHSMGGGKAQNCWTKRLHESSFITPIWMLMLQWNLDTEPLNLVSIYWTGVLVM